MSVVDLAKFRQKKLQEKLVNPLIPYKSSYSLLAASYTARDAVYSTMRHAIECQNLMLQILVVRGDLSTEIIKRQAQIYTTTVEYDKSTIEILKEWRRLAMEGEPSLGRASEHVLLNSLGGFSLYGRR